MAEQVAPREPSALMKMDPQALIGQALEKGASIEVVERMVALAKDVRAEQARVAYHAAVAKFQSTVPAIRKDRKATIEGKYDYTYASLPAVLEEVRPALHECGLTVSWETSPDVPTNHVGAACVVSHEMGHQTRSGVVTIPVDLVTRGPTPAQRVGIAMTYARRYALYNALGIAPDDDDDARDHDGGEARQSAPREPATAPSSSKPACPECGLILYKSRPEMGGGWFCWKAKGGCGAKIKEDDPRLESAPERSDPDDAVPF